MGPVAAGTEMTVQPTREARYAWAPWLGLGHWA
jgi:hypothetical protein